MIRLSRILSLNLQTRLSQDEIDALPKIVFDYQATSTSSLLLVEKCPICLTEFNDQETINKLHCTHLFHLQCISTWLSVSEFVSLAFSELIVSFLSRKMTHVQHVVAKWRVINQKHLQNSFQSRVPPPFEISTELKDISTTRWSFAFFRSNWSLFFCTKLREREFRVHSSFWLIFPSFRGRISVIYLLILVFSPFAWHFEARIFWDIIILIV